MNWEAPSRYKMQQIQSLERQRNEFRKAITRDHVIMTSLIFLRDWVQGCQFINVRWEP